METSSTMARSDAWKRCDRQVVVIRKLLMTDVATAVQFSVPWERCIERLQSVSLAAVRVKYEASRAFVLLSIRGPWL